MTTLVADSDGDWDAAFSTMLSQERAKMMVTIAYVMRKSGEFFRSTRTS